MVKKPLRISPVNIFIICLVLLTLAYISRNPVLEQLESDQDVHSEGQTVDDSVLRRFLAITKPNALKNYRYGVKLAPGCPVNIGGGEWGTEWRAVYKNGSEIKYCVPGAYESNNSYIPCSSNTPGPSGMKFDCINTDGVCNFDRNGRYKSMDECTNKCGKGQTPGPPGPDNGLGNMTKCYRFKGKNLNTEHNKQFYAKKCSTDTNVPSATLNRLITNNCPSPGWARGLCDLTSPPKLHQLPTPK